jgi:hypothetical protein
LHHLNLKPIAQASFSKPTPTEYSASFGIETENLCGKRRWIAIGAAEEAWKQLKSSIDDIIQENQRAIFKSLNVIPTIGRSCWIMGYRQESAHPTAVLRCSKQRVLQRLAKLIQKSGILREAKFHMLTFIASFDVLYDKLYVFTTQLGRSSLHSPSFCGAKVCSKDLDRSATLGGILTVDHKLHGLTVAHVCTGNKFPKALENIKFRYQFYDDQASYDELSFANNGSESSGYPSGDESSTDEDMEELSETGIQRGREDELVLNSKTSGGPGKNPCLPIFYCVIATLTSSNQTALPTRLWSSIYYLR